MSSYKKSAPLHWTKPIPQSRDRLQSRILTICVASALLAYTAEALYLLSRYAHPISSTLRYGSVAVVILFPILVVLLGAATFSAACCGAFICFSLTFWTSHGRYSLARTALPALFVLFVLTFLATRTGRSRKRRLHLAEPSHGRTTSQVLANLGLAAIVVPLIAPIAQQLGLTHSTVLTPLFILPLAALAEAAADTVSSEIGQAFAGRPVLITTLQPATPGTDGAITLLGTLAGIAAATIVAVTGTISLHLNRTAFAIILIAGITGLFADSFIGATLERRGYLGNDLVNFTSTAIATLTAAVLAKLIL